MVKINSEFLICMIMNDICADAHMSVCKQRNAAMVGMVPGKERKEKRKKDKR